jgi:CAAX protease family protein
MDDPDAPLESPPHIPGAAAKLRRTPRVVAVFWGLSGLRAGWRLLIFFAILATLSGIEMLILRALGQRHPSDGEFTSHGLARSMTHTKALVTFLVLLASWIMAKIEGRRVADYGLSLQRVFRAGFWQGAAIGFAAITVLLGVMRAFGICRFGTIALHGTQIGKYAVLFGVIYFFGGWFEESLFRGYVQFTLTTGIGFWPAALLTSAIFGSEHHSNAGETLVGTFSAGIAGFFFCLLLRRTGDLWMPIGFHAAWNWGESYFYGVANSGGMASTHLFSASFSGPPWLTGGTVGPEGSWLCVLLIAALYMLFAIWMPDARYPDPSSLAKSAPYLAPLKTNSATF